MIRHSATLNDSDEVTLRRCRVHKATKCFRCFEDKFQLFNAAPVSMQDGKLEKGSGQGQICFLAVFLTKLVQPAEGFRSGRGAGLRGCSRKHALVP